MCADRVRGDLCGVRYAAGGGRGWLERRERTDRPYGDGDPGEVMNGRILVVDDSGLARRRARGILETGGYEVIEAEDGMAALERYFIEKPDLVMLDLVMKGM